ncbi:LSB6 [Cyberlindnera jadinii]|uniref:Phosphatidylinositol 4-kinase n=1 Tax=Cyberlindnera jadinii (strain ATCC 18201 / CBS 1600 / BCRC 20928 / JCM 3617 / NBRC 0987 / NRRL Y-1542) TaxID=983966 RepID=A0A0H5CA20_CYBJN|nr:hypothetical protein CYBJADRAFT_169376 [Cyberlindnera jadinii NRRL Y-1542]ODV71537.1 hypothetical protein CYBJADRAFT_169376 [Cyberlindnera jadinii NRRL Y-1542]CEP25253.1 LSB6 [Cyberlindnera jadinii]
MSGKDKTGYEILESLDSPPVTTVDPFSDESHYQLREDIPLVQTSHSVPSEGKVIKSQPVSTSAPVVFSKSKLLKARYHDDEESQLLDHDRTNGDEASSPTTFPSSHFLNAGTLSPLNNSHTSRPKRSRSVISMRSINDTVSRWTNSITKWTSSSNCIDGVPSEIQYSVFKAPLGLTPVQSIPREGFLNQGPVTEAEFHIIVEDAIVAIETGIKPKRISAGSSGSYFIYSKQNKIVGVFKPKDEEPYGPLSPKWTKWLHRNLFPCFFGRSCLIPNLGYVCESAASLLDRQLLSNIVPYTDIVSISSDSFYYSFWERTSSKPLRAKVGSLQLFLNDYEEADKFLSKHPLPGSGWLLHGLQQDSLPSLRFRDEVDDDTTPQFRWTPDVLQQFREELEKLVILDYIMRNTDRGLDNWMIKLTWETTLAGESVPKLKIGAIDSGLAFPWKHPDEWRSYPFGWLFLPADVIGQPFSDATRRHYLPLLTSTVWWEETSLLFRELFAKDDDFKERMWKKQWAVLKGQAFNVVETLKNPTQGPLELARRTRILVWDEIMEVPVSVPTNVVNIAIETPLCVRHNNRNKPSPTLDPIQENLPASALTNDELKSPSSSRVRSNSCSESNGLMFAQESMASKKVIIERLQMVTSKPPVFTWC